MDYIAITLKGLEEFCEGETKGKKVAAKRVLFHRLKDLKSVDDVYTLRKKFKFKNFDDLVAKLAKVKLEFDGSFRVKCKREGTHAFNSIDVAKKVSKRLYEQDHKVDYKEAKNIIYVDIIGDLCFIGFLVKEDLHKRDYRVKIHNQSINPLLGYAVVKLANCKKSDIIVDPFCRDGVIPIEAALLGMKKIHAFDASGNCLRNAQINMKMAEVKFEIKKASIDWLETLFKEKSVDVIVTNLFVSRRDIDINKKLQEFFHQAHFIIKKTVVFITNNKEKVSAFYKNYFTVVKEYKIEVGDMKYWIMSLKRK